MNPDDSPDGSEIDLALGTRIRMRRKALGFTQHKLAEAIGVCVQQIQKYENATNRVSASRLWEISRALNVPVTYFFYEAAEAVRGPLGGSQTALLRCAGGLELIALLPRVEARQRRGILDLMHELARERDEGPAGT